MAGGRIKVKNETDIPNKLIAAIVRFARPPGIRKFEVVVKKMKETVRPGVYKGHGGRRGITVWIDAKAKFPRDLYVYQYGQLKQKWGRKDKHGCVHRLKGRRYYLASLTEALIYLFAHELMHTKQGQRGNVRGRVWGARGRFSEIETESYAIRKLREYRKAT